MSIHKSYFFCGDKLFGNGITTKGSNTIGIAAFWFEYWIQLSPNDNWIAINDGGPTPEGYGATIEYACSPINP